MTSVTVIGLGLMGKALAGAFVRAGHRTTVWNRTAGRNVDGAEHATDVAAAVAAAPLVVVCVVNNDAVLQVLEEAGSLAGRVLVNLTNGTPAQAREVAARVAELGGRYVDGGIMAVPQMIAGPGALVLYSGSAEAFHEHAATLEALAQARFMGTDPGLAALYDLALLSGMYGMFGGVFHAFAMVRAAGEDVRGFAPMLGAWLSAMMEGMPEQAEQIVSGDYATDVSALAMNQLAMPNFVEAAKELGLRPDVLLPIQRLIDRAVEAGHGADSLTRLVEMIKE
ncbi:NAD(P)-binding domain-containing protein [Nonomuraea sp. NPDC003804]|uniref:NAD(P)-dependent oxidoreductase n=1 Tax=Nonomuraea sp. NPDC003804 TaxID=3154547 RepID=UPI0033A933E0